MEKIIICYCEDCETSFSNDDEVVTCLACGGIPEKLFMPGSFQDKYIRQPDEAHVWVTGGKLRQATKVARFGASEGVGSEELAEYANQQGMAHGVEAFNETRGQSLGAPGPCGHHCPSDCPRCGDLSAEAVQGRMSDETYGQIHVQEWNDDHFLVSAGGLRRLYKREDVELWYQKGGRGFEDFYYERIEPDERRGSIAALYEEDGVVATDCLGNPLLTEEDCLLLDWDTEENLFERLCEIFEDHDTDLIRIEDRYWMVFMTCDADGPNFVLPLWDVAPAVHQPPGSLEAWKVVTRLTDDLRYDDPVYETIAWMLWYKNRRELTYLDGRPVIPLLDAAENE